jgi:hypothetical protein
MKSTLLLMAALAGAAPLAWAGPYDQPYGIVETGDKSEVRKHATVAISKIDGQTTRNPRRPDPVPPGKHSVDISFTSARAVVGDDMKTIEIDVEPCKRYRVVAQYTTPTSGKWEPVVQTVENIGECQRKFLGATSKSTTKPAK